MFRWRSVNKATAPSGVMGPAPCIRPVKKAPKPRPTASIKAGIRSERRPRPMSRITAAVIPKAIGTGEVCAVGSGWVASLALPLLGAGEAGALAAGGVQVN